MPTIYDVARAAGVSITTVSRALNGQPQVSAATRERVLAACRDLGFRAGAPGRRGRGSPRTPLVGVVLSDIANPWAAAVVRGIQSVVQSQGFSTVVASTDATDEREMDALTAFHERQVGGIVALPVGAPGGDQYLSRMARSGLPVVLVSRFLADEQIDLVTSDLRGGAYDATHHLIQLGHRRIACVGMPAEAIHFDTGRLPHIPGSRRVRGYLDALRIHGLAIDPELLVAGDFHREAGRAAARALFEHGDPPTAIFAANDLVATGVFEAARETGRQIPDELSVVGFDNIPFADLLAPPLTTVAQQSEELGRIAALMLLDRMQHGGEQRRREIVLQCQLVVRSSTAAPPARRALGTTVLAEVAAVRGDQHGSASPSAALTPLREAP